MRITDLAWFAAILDVKGRLYNKKNGMRATPQVVLTVDSREPAIIAKMSRMTGTKPEMNKARLFGEFLRRGCVEHCPESHVHVNSEELNAKLGDMGRWTVTGAAVVVVLTNLEPYLQVDRDYDEIMEIINNRLALTGPGSGMILDSLQRLLGLGWNLPVTYAQALDNRLKATPS